jgi:Lrp/AsnC family transcriptional regulator for asnA, asnC and gidA
MSTVAAGPVNSRRLDGIDRALIEALQLDGRRSFVELAQLVGLSEAPVRQRVHRMLDAGVMQIVAITDPITLGFHRMCMIGVKTQGALLDAAEALARFSEVDYIVVTSGTFDLIVEAVCQDESHLLSLLDRIRAIDGVRDTETFIYLRLHKQTYAWGARKPAAP